MDWVLSVVQGYHSPINNILASIAQRAGIHSVYDLQRILTGGGPLIDFAQDHITTPLTGK